MGGWPTAEEYSYIRSRINNVRCLSGKWRTALHISAPKYKLGFTVLQAIDLMAAQSETTAPMHSYVMNRRDSP